MASQIPKTPDQKDSLGTTRRRSLMDISNQQLGPTVDDTRVPEGIAKGTSIKMSLELELDLESCCDLLSPVWKYDTPPPTPATPSTEGGNLIPPPTAGAVWTINVENVGPHDKPHHPLNPGPWNEVQPRTFKRKPWGICINPRNEQIYVADREHSQVLVFRPDGEFQGHIGEAGELPGQLKRPTALAFSPVADRLYVTDKDHHRIQVFSGDGKFLFGWGRRGLFPGQFFYPWGICVSNDGSRVAVADPGNRRVQLFTADGKFISQYGTPPMKPRDKTNRNIIQTPRGLAFDHSGKYLFMTDFRLRCVFRLDLETSHLEKIIDERMLHRPSGMAVDQYGNLIVCDAKQTSAKIFRPDGVLLWELEAGTLGEPLDCAVHPAGFVAVLDSNGSIGMM